MPQDYKDAVKWYHVAADQGHATAQYNLGVRYERGQGVPQDHKEAAKWYRMAADQRHASAQYNLGVMHERGQGVPQDHKEAVRWYRMAADQGDASAQNNLGGMYERGRGVPQDYKEAVRWYRMAADQGYASAQYNLGVMYEDGRGMPADLVKAAESYLLAAAQNHALAQNNLGVVMNRVGYRDLAYALYNLSAAIDPSSNNLAAENRAKLADEMSRNELLAGQALTRKMQSGNLAEVVAAYVDRAATKAPAAERPASKRPATPARRTAAAPESDGFPARPAKRPGVVSCNTRCVNGDCWRAYDNGRKLRFQAKPTFDPFTNQMKFDAGNC